MFAVVVISGKQYKVTPGQVIQVDRIEGNVGDTVKFTEVLLEAENDETKVGAPTISGATVKAKIIAQEKGKKVEVRRYKSKVRYRKHIGFRPHLTKLEILSVEP